MWVFSSSVSGRIDPMNVAIPVSLITEKEMGQLTLTIFVQVSNGYLSKEHLILQFRQVMITSQAEIITTFYYSGKIPHDFNPQSAHVLQGYGTHPVYCNILTEWRIGIQKCGFLSSTPDYDYPRIISATSNSFARIIYSLLLCDHRCFSIGDGCHSVYSCRSSIILLLQ